MASVTTKIANLINPEVIGAFINVKLVNLIRFSPFAQIGRDLQGKAGDTITLPTYQYIGDAEDIAEGADIESKLLTATTSSVTIKKVGNAVTLTDEAILSAYGDPVGEATNQLATSIAQKVDNDCLVALGTIGTLMTHGDGSLHLDKELIADALVKFGEDADMPTYLYITPAQYSLLRKDPDYKYDLGEKIVTGQVGTIYGVNIVVTNKITVDGSNHVNNFMVRAGALGIEMKRDIAIETDRDIINKTNVIVADMHYVAYLRDASKAVKIVTLDPADAET